MAEPVFSSPGELTLEDNLKKALTEMLALHLLAQRDYFISDLAGDITVKSGGALNIVFPYSAFYRLLDSGYLAELGKRIAPDGRRRQYYGITPAGRAYLARLEECYARVSQGVAKILAEGGKGQ